jgi:flagellar biosynthesis component FlhA
MPGKQMAIDADLSSGLINEHEAKTRRKELEQESSFYGAMDGANKFVRGDAIAGILITFVNLIGGIIIGLVQRGLSFQKAVHTYTILTIGDGLVSQIPALIISLAAGLLVSKAGIVGSTDKAIFGQLGKYPQALWLSSFVTGGAALLPGLPFLPFAVLSFISGMLAYNVAQNPPKDDTNVAGNQSFPLIISEISPSRTEIRILPLKTKNSNVNNITNKEFTNINNLSKDFKYYKKNILDSLDSFELTKAVSAEPCAKQSCFEPVRSFISFDKYSYASFIC